LRLTQVLLAELVQAREWRDKIGGAGITQDRPHLGLGRNISVVARCVSHLTQGRGPAL